MSAWFDCRISDRCHAVMVQQVKIREGGPEGKFYSQKDYSCLSYLENYLFIICAFVHVCLFLHLS